MSDLPKHEPGRLPEVLLERYLAGDLSPERRRDIESRCAASPVLAARLEALRAARQAFLGTDPPAAFAARLSTRLASAPRGQRRWWLWLGAPSAAAAAAVLVAVTVSRV